MILKTLSAFYRAEGALTFECHRRTRSTLIFVCSRVKGILGFLKIFDFFLTEIESFAHVLDATIGPVVAPWIVWGVLVVIGLAQRH